jgi:hypothetical protein
MRIKEKKKELTLSRKLIAILFIPLIGGITIYLGIGLGIFLDLGAYNRDLEKYYWWDSPDYKYSGNRSFANAFQTVNWTVLKQKAYVYENWTDQYNICEEDWDCATTLTETKFKERMTSPFSNYSQYLLDLNDFMTNSTSKFRNKTDVNPIDGEGDSPMWTGNYMASLAFHYKIASDDNNATEVNEILRKLKRPVDGLHILTHVTGLPGNLARFAIKDTPENRIRFKKFFYDDKGIERTFGREHNKYLGQGDYEGWWYEAGTSRDQHIGTFFGYGIVYKILSQTTAPGGVNMTLRDYILTKIGDDGTDVLDCLIGANWHVINGEEVIGEGRGFNEASLHPRIPWISGGEIQLAFLAFGKMVNPEKYTRYYNKILNRFLTTSYIFSVDQSGAYYGNNLAFEAMFLNYFLTTDPNIKAQIRWHFNRDFFKYVQYHRNAFFMLGWMYINEYDLNKDILRDARLTYRLDDIVDNLYRFSRWRFPSRHWYIPGPPDADQLLHPTHKMYAEIFAEDSNHIIKQLYGWIFEFGDTSQKSMIALSSKETGSTDFNWQRNPFSLGGTHSWDPTYKGAKQQAGVDYTLTYWMGRSFGYFKEN